MNKIALRNSGAQFHKTIWFDGLGGGMKKLLMITMAASPHQVRFVPYLAKYFDVQHYFYARLDGRQKFWDVDMGDRCHILPCKFTWRRRYFTLSVLSVLRKEKPDVLMLGTFSIPSNYLAYLWARWHNVPVAVWVERSRDKYGKLRGYGIVWRFLHFLYRNVSRVVVVSDDIVPQFRDTFHFGSKVVVGRYPSDIDQYYKHPIRNRKDSYTLIFANRMTEIYNPVGAIDIFAEVLKRYPKTRLKINASGEMRQDVELRIRHYGIEKSVEFLDNIKTWDDLSAVYAASDIMYLPAKFSNGNYTIGECRVSGMGVIISDKVLGFSAMDMKSAGTGFIVPLDNQKFVEKICWYIEHPEAFTSEVKINREQLRYLTHEETAKAYNKLFNSMLGEEG